MLLCGADEHVSLGRPQNGTGIQLMIEMLTDALVNTIDVEVREETLRTTTSQLWVCATSRSLWCWCRLNVDV